METASVVEIFWSLISALGLGYGLKIWLLARADYKEVSNTKGARQVEVFQAGHNRKLAAALTWMMLLFLAIGVSAIFVPSGNQTFGFIAISALIGGNLLAVYAIHLIDYNRSHLRKMVRVKRKEDDTDGA
jgi:hypothetical protein